MTKPKSAKSAPKTTNIAFSYIQIAKPAKVKGDKLKRFRQISEDYAAKNGLRIDSCLELRDRSIPAPEATEQVFANFLTAVETGVIPSGATLIVETFEGVFSLRMAAHSQLLNIINAGITVVTVDDGIAHNSANTTSDPAVFMMSFLAMMETQMRTETRRQIAIQALDRPRPGSAKE